MKNREKEGLCAYSLDNNGAVIALSLHHISNNDFDYTILSELNKIETLSMQGTNFDMKVLSNLKNIKRIDLSYCGLNEFSFLKDLKSLTHLNLTSNDIPEFPSCVFNNLNNINDWYKALWDNPIQSPPIKIIQTGKEEIKNYFLI